MISQIAKTLKPAILSFVILTILCGIIYPGVVTGIAQLIFSHQADGSIVTVTLNDGTKKEYGSELIAQEFTKPIYLIGRPMKVTNLSPTSKEQEKLVQERIDWWHSFDPGNKADIPADLVTSSGSGYDPDISPEAAEYQVARIARERGISEDTVRGIIKKCTQNRLLGLWGEPAVNVLDTNLMLDGLQ
jgi:K+-transporting ATPase ATPase C chain